MKFDDCIYKEITWFNADEIVEHETFDGIDSYELLRNLATLEAGYSLDDRLDDEAAVNLMDDELRELLHANLAPCSEQEFFDAYLDAHCVKYGEEFRID